MRKAGAENGEPGAGKNGVCVDELVGVGEIGRGTVRE